MTLASVCVVGGGAIGSLCAGHLGRNVAVSVLTRRAEHAAALNAHGLRVSGKSELTTDVRATTAVGELPHFDLAIITVKAPQLETALTPFRGVAPDALFMTMQNGLGAEEIIGRHGDWPIISAVTFMSGNRHGDRHVEYELDTATWMGPYHGTDTELGAVEEVGALFDRSGLKAEVLPDLRSAQWSKLIFNSAVNAVAVLADLPHVELFARRSRPTDLGHLVRDVMDEGRAVAAAMGIELHDDPWEMNERAVSVGMTDHSDYAHVPSMLADVRAGGRTEVDFICGAIVREGLAAGVPTPLNLALWRLVRAREGATDVDLPFELGDVRTEEESP